MDDKDLQYNYFKALNDRGEGFTPTAIPDENDNPTVGSGLNLRSPATATKVQLLTGIDPNDLAAGTASLTPEQSDLVRKSIYEDKKAHFDSMKDEDFPSANFNPAQHAALMDMMYENHNLVGPQMKDRLNNNDTPGVIKEMLLNSNASDSPGEQKRRLDQAQTYGGPVDFNMTLKNMSPDERNQIRDTLNKMDNPNELNKVYQKYPLLHPASENQPEPVKFYRINKLLGE